MAGFGVTRDGFTIKGLDVILNESLTRAVQMFGPSVDLSDTSALKKILQVVAAEDGEIWKAMEDYYYSNFISTAVGPSLDQLGGDLGQARLPQFAQGQVNLTLAGAQPGAVVTIPAATILVTTSSPPLAFFTLGAVTLSATAPQAPVAVSAFVRGPAGDLSPSQAFVYDPAQQPVTVDLGAATITGVNPLAFSGGGDPEADDAYRSRLLGVPRSLWTLDSVSSAALAVDGVVDVLLSDTLGGIDVSQGFFNLFHFNERVFSSEPELGEPYFFDVVVAHNPAFPWRASTVGGVTVPGIFEGVTAAIDAVRPIGIFANVLEANAVQVAVQANIVIDPGHDPNATLTAITDQLAAQLGALKLGGAVLYSQVMRTIVAQAGVLDVQNMHLRRCDAGSSSAPIDADIGENLVMGPTEIAVFRADSDLNDLEVVPQ